MPSEDIIRVGSPNVVDCPHCKKAIGEEEATFKPVKGYPNKFKVKCLLCKKTFEAMHHQFYRRGGVMPLINPFVPLHITLPFGPDR